MSDPARKKAGPRTTEQLLAAASSALALGAVVLVLAVAGAWHRSQQALAPIIEKVEGLDVISAEHADLARRLDALTATVGDPEKLLGSRSASNQLTEAVYRVASKTGIKITRIQAISQLRTEQRGYVLGGVRASFNCELKNLVRFLEGLDRDGSVTGARDVSITADPRKPGRLSVTVDAFALARREGAGR